MKVTWINYAATYLFTLISDLLYKILWVQELHEMMLIRMKKSQWQDIIVLNLTGFFLSSCS